MATHRRRGAAAIEFAFVLLLLIPLLFGIMEYGWLFLQQSNITSAVREGTRLGVTYDQEETPDPADAAVARVNELLASYNLTGATVVAVYAGTSPDETLTVTATVPYQPLIGVRVITPDSLGASMTMLLEIQD
ncbi:MAG: TadE/TadG family type IV pilus assembly protein [Myxococcota bacterium]